MKSGIRLPIGQLIVTAAVTPAFALVFAGEAAAQGGPPMMTDDTGTPGDGKWENNVAVIVEASPAGKVVQLPNVDLNYGVGEHIQLNYQVSLAGQLVPGAPRATGLTQQAIGAKWRFLDGATEKDGVSISTYPKIGFRGPGSSTSRDLTPGDPQWQVPVEVRVGMGDVAATAEVGRFYSGRHVTGWAYGTSVGYYGLDPAQLMLEVHGESDEATRQNAWLVNVGTRVEVSDSLDVIAAIGRFIKTIGPEPAGVLYAGVTFHR